MIILAVDQQVQTLCACGCGNLAPLSSRSNRRIGLIKGQPQKMIRGHGMRLQRENPPAKIHGESHKTAEYRAWKKMRERCLCITGKDFAAYGGRGITICKEWGFFPQFVKDMGRRPTPEHSLGRKDNDGCYCPGNCEWQTASRQARNRRSSRMLSFDGRTLSMADWAERLDFPYKILLDRISGHKWDVNRAFTQKPRRSPGGAQ